MIKKVNGKVEVSFKDKKMILDLSSHEKPITNKQKESYNTYSVLYDNDDDPYYVIYVTDDCNMKCEYCFNQIKKDDLVWNKRPQYSTDDFLKFVDKNSNSKTIGIRFFGGEPLINKDWIYQFVKEMSNKGINVNYDIFTNVTLIDKEFINFAKSNNFLFYVSVNGGQDKYKGIYFKTKILEGIKKIRKEGCRVITRMVWLPNEKEHLIDLVKEIIENDVKVISITLPWGMDFDTNLFREQIEEFAEFYLQKIFMHDYRYVGIDPFVKYIIKWIFDDEYYAVSCAAGKSMICIDTNGNCYPCHCFVNIKEYCIGNIYEKSYPIFEKVSSDNLKPCKDCQYRYFCKARCMADGYFENGTPYCMNEKKCVTEKTIIGISAYILNKLIRNNKEYEAYKKILKMSMGKYSNK